MNFVWSFTLLQINNTPFSKERQMYAPQICTRRHSAAGFLVGWGAIPVNLIMAYGIAVLPAAIAGVALHGVDKAVLHLLHDAHMIGKAVLGAGAALVVIAIGNPPLLLSS